MISRRIPRRSPRGWKHGPAQRYRNPNRASEKKRRFPWGNRLFCVFRGSELPAVQVRIGEVVLFGSDLLERIAERLAHGIQQNVDIEWLGDHVREMLFVVVRKHKCVSRDDEHWR